MMTYTNELNYLTKSKILIVDDVVENLRLLSEMLTMFGYVTRKATSGRMALTAIAAVPPSLILLDIQMPEMSGYEVCRRLKSNPETMNIPIIFLSASDAVEDRMQAFSVGGNDYITKPFQVEEVVARVQRHLPLVAASPTYS
jgi:CheY-like chemotaxis protein